MRNDVAVLLAAALSSGTTWFLTRGDREPTTPVAVAPPISPEHVSGARGEDTSPPTLARPAEGANSELLAELRAMRALLESKSDSGHVSEAATSSRPKVSSAAIDFPDPDRAPLSDLAESLAAVRRRLNSRLLAVPEGVRLEYASVLAAPDAAIGRILPRGKFEDLLEVRGGGAYWSFATKSNSYDKSPDLELQSGNFSSGFYGSATGFLVDLGVLPLDRVPDRPEVLPPSFAESQRSVWEFLWSDRGEGARGYSPEFEARAKDVGAQRSATAVVGHTYVLRAVIPNEHDHLVAFVSAAGDDDGQTLVSRILKTFPMTSSRRR